MIGNYKYIGLQHGNECWADTAIGSYGKVPEDECNMPCSRDNMEHCGAGWRNLVYDLKDLNMQSQRKAKRAKANCKTNNGHPFTKDCTDFGGYK